MKAIMIYFSLFHGSSVVQTTMIALICLSVLYSTVNGLAIPYRNKFGGNNGADPRWADPNSLGGNWNEPGGWNEPVGAPEWIEQGPWPEQQGPNAQWNEPGGWNEQGAGGFDPAVGGGWNDPNAVLDPGMPAGNIPLSPAGGANPGGGGNSGNSVDIGTVITALVEAVINTKKPAPIGADAAGDFPMGGGVGPGGAPGGAPGGGDPGWQDPGTMAGGDVNWGAALGIGRPRGPDMGVDGPRPEMGIGGPLGPEMAGPGGDWLNGPVDPFEGGASPNVRTISTRRK